MCPLDPCHIDSRVQDGEDEGYRVPEEAVVWTGILGQRQPEAL